MKEEIRLSKFMSELGLASRRESERLIERGLVKVDGELIQVQGFKVTRESRVELLNEAVKEKRQKVTIMLNKPCGFVSTQPEKNYRSAIELIKKENIEEQSEYRGFCLERLAVVGRLDIESKGLLLFTQDGTLVKKIIGPEVLVEKEYLVRVDREFSDEVLKKLSFGLSLEGVKLKRAKIERLHAFGFRIILVQGKKRQIRRMCELVGLRVTSLKRVRIGNLNLSDLPIGKWKFVHPSKIVNNY
ncbi:MAG: pseudouridine synthase [Simkaniaceae bacterium]